MLGLAKTVFMLQLYSSQERDREERGGGGGGGGDTQKTYAIIVRAF